MNYDPGMIRSLMALTAAAALALAGTTPAAGASPAPPACAYTLSPPEVVQLSGTNVVTATLTPAACDESDAYLLVACVQLQGSDGPGQCAEAKGILPAQVYYQPYRPGATYISTGRGCSAKGNPPQPICLAKGPFTAAL
ncbi:MAG: hypothetical protein QOD59_4015 [Mycobacterium sp.]|nr:hypothetical protein [Mycobacterium sp.]